MTSMIHLDVRDVACSISVDKLNRLIVSALVVCHDSNDF